jgi:predicted ATPase
MRDDNIVEPFERLEPLGSNLGSAYFALRNDLGDAHWRETLELIRLGLGEQVEDVLVKAGGDGGKISLRVKYRSQLQPVPTFALSDGTLAYLAWVALYRAPRPEPPALLAFDEPELHLHPHLLMRVLDFLESLGQSSSVLVATHSDRLLDGLSRPAQQAVLCELDARGQTQLRRPNQEALARWMERYRGIGDLRSAGHDASIWSDDEPPAEKP